MPDLWIFKMIRDGPHTSASTGCGGWAKGTQERSKDCCTWKVRIRSQHRRIRNHSCVEGCAVEVQRVQANVVVGELGNLAKSAVNQGSFPRSIGKTKSRLKIVVVRGARWNQSIPLEAVAAVMSYRTSLESASFGIVAQAVVQRQVVSDLQCNLDGEAIDVVLGLNRAWTNAKIEHSRYCVG